MKNTEFAVGSKIRVIDPNIHEYRLHGRITADVTEGDIDDPIHVAWEVLVHKDNEVQYHVILKDEQITNIQKKFIDIEHIKEENVVLGKDVDGNDIVRRANTSAFEVGDLIVI